MKMQDMFLVLVSLVIFTGCSTNATKDDYETKADFTNLNTFDWFAVPQKAQLNEQVVKDAKDAVNRELAAKGMRKVSENPGFLIALHIRKQVKKENWNFSDVRYGSYRTRLPQVYEEGTMVLDFVDPETKELLWRGSRTAAIKPVLTPEKRKRMINEAVSTILDKFPPKKSR